MLSITIPAREVYDDNAGIFIDVKEHTILLEHSLVSISKWESKWHKPYLTSDSKTYSESLDYIKCMTVTQNVDPIVYSCLTRQNYEQIFKYVNDPMTATTFSDRDDRKGPKKTVTSELIYYWMIEYGIPFEAQKWHFNRLMTLIRICQIKNSKPQKMTKKDRAMLNASRRAKLGTKG